MPFVELIPYTRKNKAPPMLRNIVLNTTLKKKVFDATTSVAKRSFNSVANKHGLFGSLILTDASQSAARNKQRHSHCTVVANPLGNFVAFRSYAKKKTAPKKAIVKASKVQAKSEPEVAETQGSTIGFAQVAKKMIPHPEKADFGGEDGCFISKDNSVIGVFDGVGGVAFWGGNPRAYALALARGGRKLSDTTSTRDPRKIMEAGREEAKKINGSSTACVAVMSGDKVQMANLGDSGMFIIRPPNTSVFRSVEQQMEGRWNTPFQLPDHGVDLAHYEEIKVVKGDVVILGTDGVFDNIFNQDMIALVEQTVTKHKDADDLAKKLANAIAKQASTNAHDKRKKSPFEESSRKHGRYYPGGKLDDITVIVGIVGNVESNVSQDSVEATEPAKE